MVKSYVFLDKVVFQQAVTNKDLIAVFTRTVGGVVPETKNDTNTIMFYIDSDLTYGGKSVAQTVIPVKSNFEFALNATIKHGDVGFDYTIPPGGVTELPPNTDTSGIDTSPQGVLVIGKLVSSTTDSGTTTDTYKKFAVMGANFDHSDDITWAKGSSAVGSVVMHVTGEVSKWGFDHFKNDDATIVVTTTTTTG